MIKIRLVKECELGEKGKVIAVTRNEAHTLIDRGVGMIYKFGVYPNKMMESENSFERPSFKGLKRKFKRK